MATYTGQVLSLTKDGDTYQFDTGAVHFGICDTASTTRDKVVSIPDIEGMELYSGLCVRVKFTNFQGYSGTPSLNVNSTGAYPIYRFGKTATARYEWREGEILDFIYIQSNGWTIVDGSIANTTFYGKVKLSSSYSSSDNTIAATPSAVKAAYDLANGKISCTTENVQTALNIDTASTDDLFLKKDGTFAEVAAKPVTVTLGPITTTGGSYANTWQNTDTAKVTSDMSLVWYECPNMSLFQNDISITTGDGSIQLSCANTIAGTTSMTVRVM